ncbi:hypothetical protein [Novosphingobium sp. BW1]|uniref:hypothetical protein n=1 Tax=Novosphingobium sp. BW1 TaxID=2592621 RepID=UPI0011DEC1FF|nr:hypothetical protein [Novosphingobium sp. BW1]TYC81592.1 hypothetical protein FMM79_19355 [Novosphingobium sp. BW1]
MRIIRALCATLLAVSGAALLAGASPTRAQVFNGADLCHASSPQPKSANALPTEFSCTDTPQAYQDGSLWLRIPAQDLPADIAEEPALLVHYSRFDQLDVTFLYADGARERQSVRNGDFAGHWRIGGQLEFAPPVRTAPFGESSSTSPGWPARTCCACALWSATMPPAGRPRLPCGSVVR